MTGVEPPARLERLLERALEPSAYRDDIVGDLREAYAREATVRSRIGVRCWYFGEVLRLAARQRLRALVGPTPIRNDRELGTGDAEMDRVLTDVRFAVRALLKRPAISAAIVVTLALGIGANAAVFGVIDALIFRPYTLRDADRIVMAVETAPTVHWKQETVAPANFLDWRRDAGGGSIQHLSAMLWWEANLVGRDEPEHALGFYVSPQFFAAIGVHPLLGRAFLAEEEIAGRDRKVILSDGLWRRRFGGDPSIIGQPIQIDGAESEVVGVMPPGFNFPNGSELWAPLAFDAKAAPSRTSHDLTVLGRLAPGRSIKDAQAEMTLVADRLRRDFPRENRDRGVRVYSLAEGMRDMGVGPILSLWQAAAIFVLLIACANIANLLLARGAERGREMAVKLALGSSRGRIVREALLESLILALVAIPISLALSWVFLHLMRISMPARIVRFVAGWNQMAVDGRLLGITTMLAVGAALIFGMVPALQISRAKVGEALKSDGRTGQGPGRQRLRRALVVAEIALALPLLVAAMLSVRGAMQFLTGYQGYDPNGLLVFRATLPAARYPDVDSRRRFTQSALDSLQTIGGATAAVTNNLPAMPANTSRGIEIDGQPPVDSQELPRADYRTVSPSFFDVLRIPLRGRAFSTADRAGTAPVAIVSESFARKYWPDGDAIGRRVRVNREPWMTVVGICGDVIHDLDRRNFPTLYRPITEDVDDGLMFAIRVDRGDPLALLGEARAALARIDRAQAIYDAMTMRQALNERTIGLQFAATVMAIFALLALVLAVLGLYAVMSYLVVQRVREIGVRIALGATARDVATLALGQAARLTAIGIGIGFALALALGRLMEAGLLGIIANDTRLSLVLAAVLAVAALVSGYLPARRAAAVDPMIALRTE